MTVVAAAGEDPIYGFPGVSRAIMHGIRFRDVHDPKRILVHETKWASRAWTFQESFLSRRRLIFTDGNPLLLCNTTVKSRLIATSTWYMAENTELALKDFAYRIYDYSLNGMFDVLRHYTRRDLSFDSDALNAVVGVLNTFRIGTDPIYHTWGLHFTTNESTGVFAFN